MSAQVPPTEVSWGQAVAKAAAAAAAAAAAVVGGAGAPHGGAHSGLGAAITGGAHSARLFAGKPYLARATTSVLDCAYRRCGMRSAQLTVTYLQSHHGPTAGC